jgi:uncharacterized protein (TIGR02453 family)
MLQEYIQFAKELGQNNSKIWFDVNRDHWDKICKEWPHVIQEIIYEIAKFDSAIQFLQPKECIYRINRDVRFSKNKSPYKDYISAVFSPLGKKDGCIAYYFEITPGGFLRVGGGWYMLEPKRLLAVRNHITENLDDVSELRQIIDSKEFQKTFNGLSDSNILKTHPKGFAKDSLNIDLLKHNNFTAITTQKLSFKDDQDFVKIISKKFKIISPFIQFLRKWENLS